VCNAENLHHFNCPYATFDRPSLATDAVRDATPGGIASHSGVDTASC
jgi:hypothetical protein